MILLSIALALVISLPSVDLTPYAEMERSGEARTLLAVARRAMEAHFEGGAPEAGHDDQGRSGEPSSEIDWAGRPTGVFVSLVQGAGTRSCVGTVTPTRGSLSATVRSLAVEALRADRRRAPVRKEELANLRIHLAFAGEGETIADPMSADVGREGLLVSSPRGNIAFLPGEARTVAWALREARRVGVLGRSKKDATYRRFPVVVIEELEARGEDDVVSDR